MNKTLFPIILGGGGDSSSLKQTVLNDGDATYSTTSADAGTIIVVPDTITQNVTITIDGLNNNEVVYYLLRSSTYFITFVSNQGILLSNNSKTKLTKQHTMVAAWFDGTNVTLVGKISA